MSGGPPPPAPPPPAAVTAPPVTPAGPASGPVGNRVRAPVAFGGPMANAVQAATGSLNPIFGSTLLGSAVGSQSLGGQ